VPADGLIGVESCDKGCIIELSGRPGRRVTASRDEVMQGIREATKALMVFNNEMLESFEDAETSGPVEVTHEAAEAVPAEVTPADAPADDEAAA